MAFHRNNNGNNNRYNNNRQNFRPRHNNGSQHQQQGGQRRHVNRINHVFESNGPDGRVRGTAQQLVEKYVGLARDAHAGGDPVLMLNYYQHAEHYQRVYAEIMEENGMAEREREAQRAQHNQQPTVDGEANFAPDTLQQQNQGQGQNQGQNAGTQPENGQGHNQGGYADTHPGYQNQGNASQGTAGFGRRNNNQSHSEPGVFGQPHGQHPNQPSAPLQQAQAPQAQQHADSDAPTSGSMSTGGRVMGRRPSAPRADGRQQNQGSQLQDDHMPSFLKKDIPIKQAAPPAAKAAAAPAPAKTAPIATADGDSAEPAAAAFGKRRAPARRPAATPDDAPDA